MADKDYKVFIVEGEAREPQIIDNISKIFFSHGNYTVVMLPAGENIYMLWKGGGNTWMCACRIFSS